VSIDRQAGAAVAYLVTPLDDPKDKSMETHCGEVRSTHRVWLFYHDCGPRV